MTTRRRVRTWLDIRPGDVYVDKYGDKRDFNLVMILSVPIVKEERGKGYDYAVWDEIVFTSNRARTRTNGWPVSDCEDFIDNSYKFITVSEDNGTR